MDMVFSNISTMQHTEETGKTTCSTGKENTLGAITGCIKDNGKMIKWMVLVIFCMRMVGFIRGRLRMIRNMGKVFLYGKMGKAIRVNG